MNEVVLEIPGDKEDDILKPQKKQRWDKIKKKFVNSFVDPDGKMIKEKEGLGGNKTLHKLKDKYQKWIKKTHVRIQNAGEAEDSTMVENAKNAYKSRKEMKKERGQQQFAGKRPRNELNTPEHILKAKKKDMKKRSRGRPNQAMKYAKSERKIAQRSRPSRSRMILK